MLKARVALSLASHCEEITDEVPVPKIARECRSILAGSGFALRHTVSDSRLEERKPPRNKARAI